MVTFPERGKQTPDHRGNSEGTPKQNSLETLYRGLARVRGRGVRVCLDSGPPPPACGAVRGWGAGESVLSHQPPTALGGPGRCVQPRSRVQVRPEERRD